MHYLCSGKGRLFDISACCIHDMFIDPAARDMVGRATVQEQLRLCCCACCEAAVYTISHALPFACLFAC